MRLKHGLHLAYCANIHRGESWPETLANLESYALAVRRQVCPDRPYGLGLRLSDQASRELSDPQALVAFQRWLERTGCYVFTINGFPYGRFHGTRVKEAVYQPDWTTTERLDYTNRLFDLLAELVPGDVAGSVSTVPGSFKDLIRTEEQGRAMRQNLWRCLDHLAALSERTGKKLQLGLEPEPLCYLETSEETVRFFEQMRDDRPGDPRLARHLGVTYDTCHLAVEFEEPAAAVRRFQQHGVCLSKIQLSSALRLRATREACHALSGFHDEVYLHQVVTRSADGALTWFKDLEDALAGAPQSEDRSAEEWRIHFHIPLHCRPAMLFDTTSDHLVGVLDLLEETPQLCPHLEMETYTWEVLPPAMKNRHVVDQLVAEYTWTLQHLRKRGLG
jgi:hypothetical protein